jgi:hypothetical protein
MSFFLQEKSPKDGANTNISQGRNLSPIEKLEEEFGQRPLNSEPPIVNS